MICLLVSAAMLALLIAYLRDQRRARAARASNARVLREFKQMTLHHPEQIVSPRRDLAPTDKETHETSTDDRDRDRDRPDGRDHRAS